MEAYALTVGTSANTKKEERNAESRGGYKKSVLEVVMAL